MFILYHEKIFLSIFQTYIDNQKNVCYNKLKLKIGGMRIFCKNTQNRANGCVKEKNKDGKVIL